MNTASPHLVLRFCKRFLYPSLTYREYRLAPPEFMFEVRRKIYRQLKARLGPKGGGLKTFSESSVTDTTSLVDS